MILRDILQTEGVYMKYIIDKTLIREDVDSKSEKYVELIDFEEARKIKDVFEIQRLTKIRRSKAYVYEKGIVIMLDVPDFKNIRKKRWNSAMYLKKDSLTIIGNVTKLSDELEKIVQNTINDLYTPEQVLFSILEYMIRNDEDVLDDLFDKLDHMEEQLSRKDIREEFETKLIHHQRRISVLNRYYQQLLDLTSSLVNCPFPIIESESHHMFAYLYNRVDLYSAEAQKLKEQLVSLWDHYQIMHNERQESAVRYLTIVTSIFMPLTLLTGWYGMNFSGMSELSWDLGYEIVIVLAILILIIELYIFKKKKWL